jgi:hypothetical protein
MARFTHAEHFIIDLVYCFCEGDVRAASKGYRRRYPDRRKQNRHVLVMVYDRKKERGAFMTKVLAGRGRSNRQDEEKMLDAVQANPSRNDSLGSIQIRPLSECCFTYNA